jgi:lipoprotein-releasing system ATP-binding protein
VTLLSATNLKKTYRMGRVETPVLRGLDVSVAEGEFVAILGASGSGKSTLLHLLGGLDRPDAGDGTVEYRGRALSSMSAGELDRYRRREVGFVFQFYHLLPELTAHENVLVAGMAAHGRRGYAKRRGALRERAAGLLERMGLSERLAHRPSELSGGERQRVAIARSLLNEPAALLADEPTGNLDRAAGESILEALASLHADEKRSVVMVTHDEQLAARADRVLTMEDGRLATGEGVVP